MQAFLEKPSFSAVLRSLVLAISALTLSACGAGGSNESDSTPSSSRAAAPAARNLTLEGVAMKGAIANGQIQVYGVEEQASYHQLTASPVAEGIRTNTDGSFRIQIKKTNSIAWVVRLVADDQTTMTCDLPEGCRNTDGSSVAFGAKLKLPQGFEMYTAVVNDNASKQTAHITPLTHLAYQWSVSQAEGLTTANIVSGRELIADSLGLTNTALNLQPLDITRLSQNKAVNQDALEYSLLSAAFLSLAQADTWGDLTQVLKATAQRFATSGSLPETSPQKSEVSLQDLFSNVSTLTSGIADRLTQASALQNQLRSYAYATGQLAKELEPARITLAWNIPEQRVDGSFLHPSELNGYRILYGTRADQLNQMLEINDPYVSEYRFESLPKNTYYFSILAIDDSGNESALSNIVEATL